MFVDPGWYGTVVVETEGTNESLADLQGRCGPGAFPPRPRPVNGYKESASDREGRLVFRVLREKRWVLNFFCLRWILMVALFFYHSRPGEIWIRAVSPKERLL